MSCQSSSIKCGSMKRSCSALPQWISLRRYGSFQNLAISVRTRSCWARLMRACGGISNARSSTSPSREEAVSAG